MSNDSGFRADPDDAPRTRPDRTVAVLVAVAALVVLGVVAAWLWQARTGTQAERAPPQAEAPAPPQQPELPAPPASPLVQHPVPAEEKVLAPHEIPAALDGLLGPKAAATFLRTDAFPRRFAATVDSLGRDHSPAAMWPVLPTPGRFLVEERPEGTVIAPENASRYTPFVLLAGTVDVPAAVGLYRRMYPLLQAAYRELGFGGRYLNDRVIEVIDMLLATPEAPESPRVQLTEVKGPVPSLQPWVRYEFADPTLEALTAGQKILVRVGPVNQRRLKSMLAELRKELTRPAGPGTLAASAAVPASGASATR